MSEELTDGAIPIGTITITEWLASDGETMITSDCPEFTVIPLATQLGMLELIKESLLRGAMPPIPPPGFRELHP